MSCLNPNFACQDYVLRTEHRTLAVYKMDGYLMSIDYYIVYALSMFGVLVNVVE